MAAAAASAAQSEAETAACQETAVSFKAITDDANAVMESALVDLDNSDTSNFAIYADSMSGFALAAEDLDTAACHAIAPSMAPTVDAMVEGYNSASQGFSVAEAEGMDAFADHFEDAVDSFLEAESLAADVEAEVAAAIGDTDM